MAGLESVLKVSVALQVQAKSEIHELSLVVRIVTHLGQFCSHDPNNVHIRDVLGLQLCLDYDNVVRTMQSNNARISRSVLECNRLK